MEDRRVEVSPVGPNERPDLGIHLNLGKQLRIAERCLARAPARNRRL
jgi:hypothetical protein